MFYLDFEEKLEKLESEKKSLQKVSEENGIDISSKIFLKILHLYMVIDFTLRIMLLFLGWLF